MGVTGDLNRVDAGVTGGVRAESPPHQDSRRLPGPPINGLPGRAFAEIAVGRDRPFEPGPQRHQPVPHLAQ